MMLSELNTFETKTNGKWILTGEHAVLRGKSAIVFPLPEFTLTLQYQKTEGAAKVAVTGLHHQELQLLFWGVLEQGLEMLNLPVSHLQGHFNLHNEIPIGAGMGASAALCVAVSRWFTAMGYLQNVSDFTFAKQLEDLFHSESSGVDIAGVGASQGLLFTREQPIVPINLAWQPHWYLTPSDQVGMTNHCVKKVKNLMETNPQLAIRIDELMQNSTELALSALQESGPNQLTQLATAINQAKICFTQWGLCSGNVENCIDQLLQAGAIAAKPTGSGAGGFVLSLWDKPAPSTSLSMLKIPRY